MPCDVRSLADDEAIAMALLLGCEFYGSIGGWLVNSNDQLHPLERIRKRCGRINWTWKSKAELARDFVEWSLKQPQKVTP